MSEVSASLQSAYTCKKHDYVANAYSLGEGLFLDDHRKLLDGVSDARVSPNDQDDRKQWADVPQLQVDTVLGLEVSTWEWWLREIKGLDVRDVYAV